MRVIGRAASRVADLEKTANKLADFKNNHLFNLRY